MWLDWLKKAIQYFKNISIEHKIIIILSIITLGNVNVSNINLIDKILENERLIKKQAELYTEQVSPIINTQIQYILMSDPYATNVILLNYHNNNHSSQGFSYKYITYLTEKFKEDASMHEEDFKELSYVNYGEELNKIHNLKYLRVNSIEELKDTFPKLYRKINSCGAKAVAFYPIEGVNESVGMIVILYNQKPFYDKAYYIKSIASRIQRLAILLDYNQFKEHIEK